MRSVKPVLTCPYSSYELGKEGGENDVSEETGKKRAKEGKCSCALEPLLGHHTVSCKAFCLVYLPSY